ncbi:MAG: polyhydroxyalkanoic acid system family protein [Burkholderiaceae bacterium]|nr:polyhydroxyalkanoic acid system family protein [Burkholderiaceae bacterium]
MTTFHIHRAHSLGRLGAARLADHWAEAAQQEHQMGCTMSEDAAGQRVEFERPGVRGELIAGAGEFALTVTLGFLLSAFSDRIRQEIEKNLDAAIAKAMSAAPDDSSADRAG